MQMDTTGDMFLIFPQKLEQVDEAVVFKGIYHFLFSPVGFKGHPFHYWTYVFFCLLLLSFPGDVLARECLQAA